MISNIELTIIEPQKRKFGQYILIIDACLIACGLILSNFNYSPYNEIGFVCAGLPFISIFIFLGMNQSIKNFRLTDNRIIIQQRKIVWLINGIPSERPIKEVKKITLRYRGYDQGSFHHPLLDKTPTRGDGNFLEIEFIDTGKEAHEFYIQRKRDAIALRNELDSLRPNVEVEIVIDKQQECYPAQFSLSRLRY